MFVKELIEQLQKYPPSAEVVIDRFDMSEIIGTSISSDGEVVYIEVEEE